MLATASQEISMGMRPLYSEEAPCLFSLDLCAFVFSCIVSCSSHYVGTCAASVVRIGSCVDAAEVQQLVPLHYTRGHEELQEPA